MRFLWIFLLFSFSLSAQFNGTLNVYSVSGTGPYTVSGFFLDNNGYYTSDSSQIGDVFFGYVSNGCYQFTIDSIISNTGSLITARMTNDESAVTFPTGIGAIMRKTNQQAYPITVPGVSSVLFSCINTRFANLADAAGADSTLFSTLYALQDTAHNIRLATGADPQDLAIQDRTLSIEGANSVEIPVPAYTQAPGSQFTEREQSNIKSGYRTKNSLSKSTYDSFQWNACKDRFANIKSSVRSFIFANCVDNGATYTLRVQNIGTDYTSVSFDAKVFRNVRPVSLEANSVVVCTFLGVNSMLELQNMTVNTTPAYDRSAWISANPFWFSGWKLTGHYVDRTNMTDITAEEGDAVQSFVNFGNFWKIYDQTGSTRRPTITYKNGYPGYQFDGSLDQFIITDRLFDNIHTTGRFTFIIRYFPNASATPSGLIMDSRNGSAANKGFVITQASDGTINFTSTNGSANITSNTSIGFKDKDGWYTAVIKSDSTTIQFLTATRTWTSGSITGAYTTGTASRDVYIGSQSNGTSNFFNGAIADIVYFKSAIADKLIFDYLDFDKQVDLNPLNAGGSNYVKESGFSPLDFPRLRMWYDMSDSTMMYKPDGVTNVSSANDTIFYVYNKATNHGQTTSRLTTTSASTAPLWTATKNGKKAAHFDGSNDLFTLNTQLWNGPVTLFLVAGNENIGTFSTFMGYSSGTSSFIRMYGDSTSSGNTIYDYGYASARMEFGGDAQRVSAYQHSDVDLKNKKDSLWLIEVTWDDVFKTFTLNGKTSRYGPDIVGRCIIDRIGKLSTNTSMKGHIAELIVVSGLMNTDQTLATRKYLADKWNISNVDTTSVKYYSVLYNKQDPDRTSNRVLFHPYNYYYDSLANDGVTTSLDFFRGGYAYVADDTLYHYVSVGQDHSASSGMQRLTKIVSGDGLYDQVVSDQRWIIPTAGRFIIKNDTVIATSVSYPLEIIRMSRDFTTIFSRDTINTGALSIDPSFVCQDKITIKGDESWYIALYERATSSTYQVRVLRSTNNGVSWSIVVTIPSIGGSFRPEEPYTYLSKGDTVQCLIRTDYGCVTWQIKSGDGTTWTSKDTAFRGCNFPSAIRLTDGTLVASATRYIAYNSNGTITPIPLSTYVENIVVPDAYYYTAFYVSWDNGNTWQGPWLPDKWRNEKLRHSQEGGRIVEIAPGIIRMYWSSSQGYWIPSATSDHSYADYIIGPTPGDVRQIFK